MVVCVCVYLVVCVCVSTVTVVSAKNRLVMCWSLKVCFTSVVFALNII